MNFFETLVKRLKGAINRANDCYREDDLEANHIAYGEALAYRDVISDCLGHEVVFYAQDQIDGYYFIAELAIDGELIKTDD